MVVLLVSIVEAGVILESKLIIPVFFASMSSFMVFWIQLTIYLTQGIDEIISSIFF
jgi:hypothetical protein